MALSRRACSLFRFLVEIPAAYLGTLRHLNIKSQTINDIGLHETSILEQQMDSVTSRNALERCKGSMIANHYRR